MTKTTPHNSAFDVVALDADDTLWHNEGLYVETRSRLQELLSAYVDEELVAERLHETEMRNLSRYGYGIKSFTLSMIESAIELTGGQIAAPEIAEILHLGKAMLGVEVMLLDHVPETVRALSERYELMVITKGDLLDQETKLERSGIAEYFRRVEVVSHKRPEVYARLLKKHGIAPERFVMAGNSLRSDVLPVVEIGGHAVHVPYAITWEHEHVEEPGGGYHRVDHLRELPALLEQIGGPAF